MRGRTAGTSAETARPRKRGGQHGATAGWPSSSPSYTLKTGGWRRRPGQERLASGALAAFQSPCFSKPHVHGAAPAGRTVLAPAAEPLLGQAALSWPVRSPGPGRDWRESTGAEQPALRGDKPRAARLGHSVQASPRVVATRVAGFSTARKLFLLWMD